MAKAAYLGVDGIARNSDTLYVGVDAVSRTVIGGYIGVDAVARQFWVWPPVDPGTQWVITEDSEWECPADGVYLLELHGGGGASWGVAYNVIGEGFYSAWASGGGSGEMFEVQLKRGDKYPITIGQGGTMDTFSTHHYGGTTSFGDLASVAGGGSAMFTTMVNGAQRDVIPGPASGSLAAAGTYGIQYAGNAKDATYYAVPGGFGNVNNQEQTYGNGASTTTDGSEVDGEPGAIIITYMGRS